MYRLPKDPASESEKRATRGVWRALVVRECLPIVVVARGCGGSILGEGRRGWVLGSFVCLGCWTFDHASWTGGHGRAGAGGGSETVVD